MGFSTTASTASSNSPFERGTDSSAAIATGVAPRSLRSEAMSAEGCSHSSTERRASRRKAFSADASVHPPFASTRRRTSGPAASRTTAARARSSSRGACATFNLTVPNPSAPAVRASRANAAGSREARSALTGTWFPARGCSSRRSGTEARSDRPSRSASSIACRAAGVASNQGGSATSSRPSGARSFASAAAASARARAQAAASSVPNQGKAVASPRPSSSRTRNPSRSRSSPCAVKSGARKRRRMGSHVSFTG